MKNEDIHKGLSDRTVRDFLGKQWAEQEDECSELPAYYKRLILEKEEELRELKRNLEQAERREVTEKFIENNGWEVHDIVGLVDGEYFPFIGDSDEFSDFEDLLESPNGGDLVDE